MHLFIFCLGFLPLLKGTARRGGLVVEGALEVLRVGEGKWTWAFEGEQWLWPKERSKSSKSLRFPILQGTMLDVDSERREELSSKILLLGLHSTPLLQGSCSSSSWLAMLLLRPLLDVRWDPGSLSSGDDCMQRMGESRIECHSVTSHVVKLDLSYLGGSTPIESEVIASCQSVLIPHTQFVFWTNSWKLVWRRRFHPPFVYLNSNKFTGRIPLTLQGCSRLLVMDLSFNELSDDIPSGNGGSLKSLRFLSLWSNKLSGGEIPLELSLIPSLQVLDLARNKLSGSLPPGFGNFSWPFAVGLWVCNHN